MIDQHCAACHGSYGSRMRAAWHVILGAAYVLLAPQGQPADLEAFSDHLANNFIPNTVIVDCTASGECVAAVRARAGRRAKQPNQPRG